MATAAGAAVMLYYVLSRRLARKEEDEGEDHGGEVSKSSRSVRRRRISRRPAQAPATLLESIVTLSETLRFTYSETLGKWPIGDLAFGINYFMRKQVNFLKFLFKLKVFLVKFSVFLFLGMWKDASFGMIVTFGVMGVFGFALCRVI